MINISSAIAVLLERMDTNPEEFVNPLRSLVNDSCSEITYGSRWHSITESILEQNTVFKVFTAEEVNAYQKKLACVFRKKLEEDVCQELLNPHKEPEQMELFPNQSSFPPRTRPSSILTTKEMHDKALKILSDELNNGTIRSTMNDPTGHIL